MASHFMRAFDIIDKDHSGVLDVGELRQFMIDNNYERHFVEVSYIFLICTGTLMNFRGFCKGRESHVKHS